MSGTQEPVYCVDCGKDITSLTVVWRDTNIPSCERCEEVDECGGELYYNLRKFVCSLPTQTPITLNLTIGSSHPHGHNDRCVVSPDPHKLARHRMNRLTEEALEASIQNEEWFDGASGLVDGKSPMIEEDTNGSNGIPEGPQGPSGRPGASQSNGVAE